MKWLNTQYNKERQKEDIAHIRELLSHASNLWKMNIIFSDDPKMVMAVNTSGDKINKPDLIINREAVKTQWWLTDAQVVYILEHEMGHIYEDGELRGDDEWEKKYQQHLKNMESEGMIVRNKLWKLENALRDIYVNKRTTDIKNMPVLKNEEQYLYKENFFKETDYRKLPLHKQLEYGLLREAMVPWEECKVDEKVRRIMKRLQRNVMGKSMIEEMSTGDLGKRYSMFEEIIRPVWKELYKTDIEEQKRKQEEKKNEQGWEQGWERFYHLNYF